MLAFSGEMNTGELWYSNGRPQFGFQIILNLNVLLSHVILLFEVFGDIAKPGHSV